jgi:hypothetical protein
MKPSIYIYNELLNVLHHFMHVIRLPGYGDDEGEFTFTNHMGASVIDLCIVNNSTDSVSTKFKITGLEYSNHFPISIDINKNMPTAEPKNKIKAERVRWNPGKLQDFCKSVDLNISLREGIENMKIQDLLEIIHSSARQCGMVKTINLG